METHKTRSTNSGQSNQVAVRNYHYSFYFFYFFYLEKRRKASWEDDNKISRLLPKSIDTQLTLDGIDPGKISVAPSLWTPLE